MIREWLSPGWEILLESVAEVKHDKDVLQLKYVFIMQYCIVNVHHHGGTGWGAHFNKTGRGQSNN